jgi:putative PEP-CTERM system TPR-repeat lipoprotein
LYKTIAIAVLALLLCGGCTSSPQTKEELFQAGTRELQTKNAAQAVIHFKNALERDPNYLEARFQLGRAYSLSGKYEAAEKEFQKILRQRPGAHEARTELSRVYSLSGKGEQALRALDGLPTGLRKGPDVLEISGRSHAASGRYPEALADLKQSLLLKPDNAAAKSGLARVYLLADMHKEARTAAAEILKQEPNDREALYLLADICIREKNRAGAMQIYDIIHQKEPKDSLALFRKGLLLLEEGRSTEAGAVSDRLVVDFPGQADGYHLKGMALFQQKNYKQATAFLQRSAAARPNPGTLYLLGLCHYYSGELEQASNQMLRALSSKPDLFKARIILSLIQLKRNNADGAAEEIGKVLAVQDRNALAHSILGSTYLARGRTAEGMAELNRALEIDPGLVDARLKKGVVELARGRTGEAESELAAAVRFNPDLLNIRLLLASYYLRQNDPARAAATARQGLRQEKSDAVLYNIMADAGLRTGKIEEATAALERALQADPAYETTYFKMAAVHHLAGRREQALKLLKDFARNYPQNPRAQLSAAFLLERAENAGEAAVYYERARSTGSQEGVLESARYYLRAGKGVRAEHLLDEGIRKYPLSAPLLILKGQVCRAGNKYGEALQAYEELAKSNLGTALQLMTRTYLDMNKPEAALQRLRRETKRNEHRPELQAEISRLYLKMGRQAEARANALRIIERDPGFAGGYLTLSAIEESTGNRARAIEVLRTAPVQDAAITIALGNLALAEKKYSTALAQFKSAEALQPGAVNAVFLQAATLQQAGNRKEAIAHYRRVLKLSSEHVAALNNLAMLCLEEPSLLSEALQHAVHAYALAPQDGPVQDTLGCVLVKNGKIAEGIRILRLAAETARDNPTVYYHLALALQARKEHAEAAAFLDKALSLGEFPEAQGARTLRSRITLAGTGR